MDPDTYNHIVDLAQTLDQALAAAQEALPNLARSLHAVPPTDLLPPGRTWMITHLYEIQTNLRGAENHIAALVSRLEIHRDQTAERS